MQEYKVVDWIVFIVTIILEIYKFNTKTKLRLMLILNICLFLVVVKCLLFLLTVIKIKKCRDVTNLYYFA